MIFNLVNRVFKGSSSIGRVSSAENRLRRQLMTIVHGEQAIANRLVTYEKRKNPGKTEQWYLEKIIYDLRR